MMRGSMGGSDFLTTLAADGSGLSRRPQGTRRASLGPQLKLTLVGRVDSWIVGGLRIMNKLGFLGFLGFLGCLGFLRYLPGYENLGILHGLFLLFILFALFAFPAKRKNVQDTD